MYRHSWHNTRDATGGEQWLARREETLQRVRADLGALAETLETPEDARLASEGGSPRRVRTPEWIGPMAPPRPRQPTRRPRVTAPPGISGTSTL